MARILTHGGDAVVTGGASSRHDTRVIKHRGYPRRSGMAVVTGILAGNMCGVLTDGDGAVMAAETSTQHL